jgi:VacB/RNase II family 3'-5' exoribonuclease
MILQRIARRVMIERGLVPDFPADVIKELEGIIAPAVPEDGSVRDLRDILWCSIDNDDSRDLDQLTAAKVVPGDAACILVAIADVDAVVKKLSAADRHAMRNTTSVYTAAETFPMLPDILSTDLTSLNYEADRLAVVVEMTINSGGAIIDSDIYRAAVRNHAKLAYNSVAAWLEGERPMPPEIGRVKGLDENIWIQYRAAQKLRALRHQNGALDLETMEVRPVFAGNELKDLEAEGRNMAKDIIEDFMIAANGITARYLESKKYLSLRRVVHTPKSWERIVGIAAEHGVTLPSHADAKALQQFLVSEKTADPVRFPDLSLSIIKLLGPGEYAAQIPGNSAEGHFGLAVRDYDHSTAPNRRYPDLVTQRLLKAALEDLTAPYGAEELEVLARHCTLEEDAAKKVERQVTKSAAAMLMGSRIGEVFDAVVTGAAAKGTWVRLRHPPVEGRLTMGYEGLEVGNMLRVVLLSTDPERGFIDFKKSTNSEH